MKKYFNCSLATFLLAFVFVSGFAAQTSSQTANRQLEAWKIFSPAGRDFKVSLPAEPRELGEQETQTVVTALKSQIKKSGDQFEISFYDNVSVYELNARWNGFAIIVIDYKWQKIDYDEKSGVLTLSSEKTSEDIVLREWLELEKAKMLPNGVFVSEINFIKDGKNFKARAFATKNRVCLLSVAMPDLNSATPALAAVYQAEADKFFNSFQISDNRPQIARGTAKSEKTPN
ncbi:MAG: hypothetical protein M3209_16620 [Acidobacteriota bacterium]|nr:hypothetical protein [Acidobacteriota bacterium]